MVTHVLLNNNINTLINRIVLGILTIFSTNERLYRCYNDSCVFFIVLILKYCKIFHRLVMTFRINYKNILTNQSQNLSGPGQSLFAGPSKLSKNRKRLWERDCRPTTPNPDVSPTGRFPDQLYNF